MAAYRMKALVVQKGNPVSAFLRYTDDVSGSNLFIVFIVLA